MTESDLAPAQGTLDTRAPGPPPRSAQAPPAGELQAFTAMETSFRSTGGLVSGDQVVELMRRRVEQPLSLVARWIHERRIVSYEWRGGLMVPLFQFDRATMALHPAMRPVMGELREVLDDYELALWFATGNAWLDGATPAARIADNGPLVVDAARADRFLTQW